MDHQQLSKAWEPSRWFEVGFSFSSSNYILTSVCLCLSCCRHFWIIKCPFILQFSLLVFKIVSFPLSLCWEWSLLKFISWRHHSSSPCQVFAVDRDYFSLIAPQVFTHNNEINSYTWVTQHWDHTNIPTGDKHDTSLRSSRNATTDDFHAFCQTCHKSDRCETFWVKSKPRINDDPASLVECMLTPFVLKTSAKTHLAAPPADLIDVAHSGIPVNSQIT